MASLFGGRILLRDETVIPSACYGTCNAAYAEEQKGSPDELCRDDVQFMKDFNSCQDCIRTKVLDSNSTTDGLGPAFQKFLDYCSGVTPLISQTLPVTTVVGSAWITYTIAGGQLQSQLATITMTITNFSASALPGSSTSASLTGALGSDATTAGPSSSTSAQPTESNSSNKTWIAGAVLGPIAVLAIVLVGIALWIRRNKRRNQTLTRHELHSSSMDPKMAEGDKASPWMAPQEMASNQWMIAQEVEGGQHMIPQEMEAIHMQQYAPHELEALHTPSPGPPPFTEVGAGDGRSASTKA